MKNSKVFSLADCRNAELEARRLRSETLGSLGKSFGKWLRAHLHVGGQQHTA